MKLLPTLYTTFREKEIGLLFQEGAEDFINLWLDLDLDSNIAKALCE